MRYVTCGILFALVLFACGAPIDTQVHRLEKGGPPTTLALLQGMPDTVFLPAPLVRQARSFSCGAAALQSLLAYHGDDFREGQLQRLLGTDYDNGTSFKPMKTLVERVLNVAAAKEKALSYPACEEDRNKTSPAFQNDCVQGNAAVETRLDTFVPPGTPPLVPEDQRYTLSLYPGVDPRPTTKPLSAGDGETRVPLDGLTVRELEEHLRLGRPALILLQAYPEDPQPGWEAGWGNGHFVLVIGFDARHFYFLDPSATGRWNHLPRADLVRRWHDEDALRLNGKTETLRTFHFAFVLHRKPAFPFGGPIPRME